MLVALYPRVSSQEQVQNGHSMDEQIERMKKYCDAMGWTVYDVYPDGGYSGGTTDRPALQKMIKDVKAKKVDKVLVYKLDRLSRSQLDTLYLIEKVFLANDCDFVSMNENFDTATPFGRAMIGILAVFAQLEREQIKERMKMGKEARAKKGKFSGGLHTPIGYDYIDGELKINEYEAMQIRDIFNMIEAGKTAHSISKEFNNKGYSHKHGKWTEQAIRRVVRAKNCIGYISYAGEWYPGTHDPIISQEQFYAVNHIMDMRKEAHFEKNSRAGKATSYLGGFIYCKQCGAKYNKDTSRTKKKNGDGYYIYERFCCCSRHPRGRKDIVKDPNCKNKYWKCDELTGIVLGEIKKMALDPDYMNELRTEIAEDDRPAVIKGEIENIDQQISRLLDLYTIGQMPLEALQGKIKELNDRKNKLEIDIEEISEENKKRLSKAEALKIIKTFDEVLERGDLDEVRAVITILIDKIELDNDDVLIHWNFL